MRSRPLTVVACVGVGGLRPVVKPCAWLCVVRVWLRVVRRVVDGSDALMKTRAYTAEGCLSRPRHMLQLGAKRKARGVCCCMPLWAVRVSVTVLKARDGRSSSN